MPTLTLVAQDVNGDPLISGGNINIVNGSTSTLTFEDTDRLLFTPQTGETVSIDGGPPLVYEFLGYGDVRQDTLQHAAFIRVETSPGVFQTFAIDMNADGDAAPTLATGNTKLATADLTSDTAEGFPAPACFTPWNVIETPSGPKLIARLRAGDRVWTRDSGAQVIRDVLTETVAATGVCAPVLFEKGALGNSEPLLVSQQHGMLITGWRAQLLTGMDEVLVPARHLVDGRGVRLQPGGWVTYVHLVFDRHEIVDVAGIPSESYLQDDVLGGVARMRVSQREGLLLAA